MEISDKPTLKTVRPTSTTEKLVYPHAEVVRRFCDAIAFNYVLDNGQSIIRSCRCESDTELKNSEIHISNVPAHMDEVALFKLFSRVGLIYELRLMIKFSNKHRGFAYATYFSPEDAKRALRLNRLQVTSGHYLYVHKSVNNCTLYFGRIPREVQFKEFRANLEDTVSGIESIFLPADVVNESCNRGFAFVEFRNHKSAANARKILGFDSFQLAGQVISVDWSIPILEIDTHATRLYLYNLSFDCTNEDIKSHVSHLIGSSSAIKRVCKIKDFCFVHFRTKYHAERAYEALQGTQLLNKDIYVKWARPVSDKVSVVSNVDYKNYMSLPTNLKRNFYKALAKNNNDINRFDYNYIAEVQ